MSMTDQQWQVIESALVGLSPQDKLEVAERLLHELRLAGSGAPSPGGHPAPMTEDEFKRHLLRIGLISSLPTPVDPGLRPVFEPIALEGEPLSETIIRERR